MKYTNIYSFFGGGGGWRSLGGSFEPPGLQVEPPMMIYSATFSATCLFLYKPIAISHYYFLRFRNTTFVS